MRRRTLALLAAMIAPFAAAAFAQTAPTETVTREKCDTVTVSSATRADIAQLALDAQCYARRMVSAANSQGYRLARQVELAAQPEPGPVSNPAPSPDPAPVVGADGIPQLPIVAPNYDRAAMLQKAWGNGAIPGGMGADPVGAFRLMCGPSHLSYDDPIVYPGQPGKSHLHLFFGNSGTDASSTYDSLRTSGTSTCGLPNRSAYWMPALLDGKGNVVLPDYATVYYKRYPASDPNCAPGTRAAKGCIGLPRGLRYIFGRTMEGGAYGTNRTDGVNFVCVSNSAVTMSGGDFGKIAGGCPAGAQIGVQIVAPDCWDGQNLDTPDHRSHTHFTVYGNDGKDRCPAGFPYMLPTFTFDTWYTVPPGGLAGAEFSSDKMMGLPAGRTVHTDWFGAWDDETLATWLRNCIDGHRNASGGDLCDGTQMIGAQQPSYGWKNPNELVPVPAAGSTVPVG